MEQVKDLIETRYGNSFLFRRGLDKKKAYFEEGRLVTDSKYDMLVFRDIRQKLFGGNLRLVLIDYNGKCKKKSLKYICRKINLFSRWSQVWFGQLPQSSARNPGPSNI